MTVLIGPQLTHLKNSIKIRIPKQKKQKHIISSFYNENHKNNKKFIQVILQENIL